MRPLTLLINSLLLISSITSQPYDLISKTSVNHVFASVGFTYIDDKQWYTLTTPANQFVKDTALFVTIPQVSEHNPAVIKMKQQTTLNADKTVTFSIKIVQPNDSFCSKSFGWTPKYLPLTQVSWMVFELGAYTIKDYTFIAGKGTMTRASWSTSATFTNQNLIAVPFPTGCTSSTDPCVFPAGGITDRGAIGLIQTNNNVKETGKDLYLTVRAKVIDQRRGQWVLVPHDVAPGVLTYHVLSAETLGFLVFPTNIKIECLEKMVWETAYYYTNYVPAKVTYKNKYDYPPGVFGTIGSITSLCDTSLVSSNWTTTGGAISISEDRCAKYEYIHTTSEIIFLVVVGQKDTTNSTYQCFINFNSALSPTPVPSPAPSRPPVLTPTRPPSRSPSRSPTKSPN